MAKFSKNEILTLNNELNISGTVYKKGSRFVVTKVTSTSTHVTLLDLNKNLTDKGINGGHLVIECAFTSTNTKWVAPKVESAKKGEFYTFKKDFTEDSLHFPIGTRVVIVKGGANPAFETLYKQEDKSVSYVSGLSVRPKFITEYLQISEAVSCDLTADFQMKNLRELTGRGSRNFELSIYHKGKKIGEASNDGCGGCHRVHIYDKAWKELLAKGFEIAQAVTTVTGEKFKVTEHNIEENTVDFFLENSNGLTTYKEYIERYVHEYCKPVDSL